MRRPVKNAMLLLFLWVGALLSSAQTSIHLKNPSFEWDELGAGKVPRGWMNAGKEQESPPDIQPCCFQVWMGAIDGKQFLGLVTRDNNTWEGVSQLLDGWLMKDSAYVFTVSLARSDRYISLSKTTNQEANYTHPTVLKIWGYNTVTKQEELLALSTPVDHKTWQAYTFVLQPKHAAFNQIDLMAYYASAFEKTNGNLLVDDCSDLVLRSQVSTPDTLHATRVEPSSIPKERPMAMLLKNPSFEEEQERVVEEAPNVLVNTKKLSGWVDMSACKNCGITHEPSEQLRSKMKAKSGKRFVGLHVYEEGGYERLAQDLAYPLQKDSTYQFAVSAAKAKKYRSPYITGASAPVILRVVGIDPLKGKSEILGQTPPIEHDFWYEYKFMLTPKNGDYDYLVLEAFFSKQEKNKYYNGHVLLDDCSPILEIKQ